MARRPGTLLAAPIVALASTPSGHGYWLLGADGGIFTYGDAGFHGSAPGTGESGRFVGMAPTSDGGGHWLANVFGGVSNYGDAANLGAIGVNPAAPTVGIAATHMGMGV
jgi:hypothetical protein